MMGGLLLLCLIVGGYGFISRQPPIVVRFVGYVDDGHQGWLAVFHATNAVASELACETSFQQGSNDLTMIKSPPEVLAPRSGATWIYRGANTNLASRLQIKGYALPSPLADRWNHLVAETLPTTIAKAHWLMILGRKFKVTCPAEVH